MIGGPLVPGIERFAGWMGPGGRNTAYQVAQDAKARAKCEVCGDPVGRTGSISINYVRRVAYGGRCPLHLRPGRRTLAPASTTAGDRLAALRQQLEVKPRQVDTDEDATFAARRRRLHRLRALAEKSASCPP